MVLERRSGVDRRTTPRGGRRSTDKVTCPACLHPVSAVVDSRGPVRLRICDGCGASYVTIEQAARLLPRGSRRLARSEGNI